LSVGTGGLFRNCGLWNTDDTDLTDLQ